MAITNENGTATCRHTGTDVQPGCPDACTDKTSGRDRTTRMSVDEIALMREIVRWRRGRTLAKPYAARAEFYRNRWHALGGDWAEVAYEIPEVDEYNDAYAVLYYSRGRYSSYATIEVRTVTQAVDLLVALGFLPLRFSSGYRAGWHASQVWHDDDEAHGGDEFKRLFHDPENVSFPAGVEADR